MTAYVNWKEQREKEWTTKVSVDIYHVQALSLQYGK